MHKLVICVAGNVDSAETSWRLQSAPAQVTSRTDAERQEEFEERGSKEYLRQLA
jgi:hypothetical protein